MLKKQEPGIATVCCDCILHAIEFDVPLYGRNSVLVHVVCDDLAKSWNLFSISDGPQARQWIYPD